MSGVINSERAVKEEVAQCESTWRRNEDWLAVGLGLLIIAPVLAGVTIQNSEAVR